MNENINLCEILKDCPKGTELYSSIHGKVLFSGIDKLDICPIEVIANGYDGNDSITNFAADGRYLHFCEAECVLFPSKDQRDWSKWQCPKPKKPKFDPKTLKPFDRVLVRDTLTWECSFFNRHLKNPYPNRIGRTLTATGGSYSYCIPYNDDTKHLVGTKEEAPEFYRYWED